MKKFLIVWFMFLFPAFFINVSNITLANWWEIDKNSIWYTIKNSKLTLTRSNIEWANTLSIVVLDKFFHGYELLATVPTSNKKYTIDLTKDFLSKYLRGSSEIEFELTAKGAQEKSLYYIVNVKLDPKGFKWIDWDWYLDWKKEEILSNWYSREKNNAYSFAYNYWLTTTKSIKEADMDSYITRAQLAKMMSNFAKNLYLKFPDQSKRCTFNDVSSSLDKQYGNWITESCKLWIMWAWVSNFNPNGYVTRAEFATALSRLLFKTDDWNPYYKPHMTNLKNWQILTDTNPNIVEKRGSILLMFMRAALMFVRSTDEMIVLDSSSSDAS